MRFIANWTAEDIAAEAQGAFTVLQQGASVIAILVFGRMVTGMGAGAYWGSLGLAIAGAGLIFASMLMRQPKG
jgi:PPP family 3-phenylpropionic acid transporter